MSTPLDTLTDTPTDAAGDVFDPELHSAKPDGSPSFKTDGTFRKKRRDAAGGSAAGLTSSSTRRKSSGAPAGTPKVLAEQHARHVQAIKDAAGVPMMALSFASPIDAFTLSDLVPSFAEALATVAQDTPQLAAVLDKVGGVGGWTTVAAIVGLGAIQVMHNHDRIPEHIARMVGAKPKSETVKLLGQRAADLQRRAAEQAEGMADAA